MVESQCGGLLQLLDCLTAEEGLCDRNVLVSLTFYYVNCSRIPHFKSYDIVISLDNVKLLHT